MKLNSPITYAIMVMLIIYSKATAGLAPVAVGGILIKGIPTALHLLQVIRNSYYGQSLLEVAPVSYIMITSSQYRGTTTMQRWVSRIDLISGNISYERSWQISPAVEGGSLTDHTPFSMGWLGDIPLAARFYSCTFQMEDGVFTHAVDSKIQFRFAHKYTQQPSSFFNTGNISVRLALLGWDPELHNCTSRQTAGPIYYFTTIAANGTGFLTIPRQTELVNINCGQSASWGATH
jgi:hypothetical protein